MNWAVAKAIRVAVATHSRSGCLGGSSSIPTADGALWIAPDRPKVVRTTNKLMMKMGVEVEKMCQDAGLDDLGPLDRCFTTKQIYWGDFTVLSLDDRKINDDDCGVQVERHRADWTRLGLTMAAVSAAATAAIESARS
jgi:hypothetical protein